MTVDGFTMSGNAYMKASVSGKTVTGCTFSNNIITNSNKTYTIDMDRGYNIATVITNNRVVNTAKTVFIGGGAMYDVKFEGNYFENVTGTPFWLTSCGNNSGIESLISFKNNVFNTVSSSVQTLTTRQLRTTFSTTAVLLRKQLLNFSSGLTGTRAV